MEYSVVFADIGDQSIYYLKLLSRDRELGHGRGPRPRQVHKVSTQLAMKYGNAILASMQ